MAREGLVLNLTGVIVVSTICYFANLVLGLTRIKRLNYGKTLSHAYAFWLVCGRL